MRWLTLAFLLCACAEQAFPAACTTCSPMTDDGLDALAADPRATAARAHASAYVTAADAARSLADALEGEAREELTQTARLYMLAAIVEEERRALTPAVTTEARIELDAAARLEVAREDASAIAEQNLGEAATDEERRLSATARERRSTRAQAAALLAAACEEGITAASASLSVSAIADFRSRLSSATAQRDLDARYEALDQLAIDLREALRSLVP